MNCKYCGNRLIEAAASHNKFCPKFPLICNIGCGVPYPRDERHTHRLVCPAELRACPIQKGLGIVGECGCKDKNGKAKIPRGLVKNHLSSFLTEPANVALAVQSLLRKNKSLKEELYTLKKKVRHLEKDTYDIQDQVTLENQTFSEPYSDEEGNTDYED